MTAKQKAEMLAAVDAAESEIAGLLDEAEAEVARERQLKDSARARWAEAQDRLAEIEQMLIGITGEQCGIVANIGILQGSLLNLREANQEGKRALSDRDAEIARLKVAVASQPSNTLGDISFREAIRNEVLATALRENEGMQTEIARLRGVIEDAPHAPDCKWDKGIQWCMNCGHTTMGHLDGRCLNGTAFQNKCVWQPREPIPCDCWKAKARLANS